MIDTERELSTPQDAVDLYPEGEYLKHQHLRGHEVTLKIERVGRREIQQPDKTWKIEPYVIFHRTEKMEAMRIPAKLTLNVTLRKSLEAMFGDRDIQGSWVGKRVTLFTGRDFRPDIKQIGPCIRFKGSPDITAPVSFIIQKKMAKPVTHTMVPVPERKNERKDETNGSARAGATSTGDD